MSTAAGPFSERELGQRGPRCISTTDIVGLPCQRDIVEMIDRSLRALASAGRGAMFFFWW
jgi:hypothetical protein